MTIVVCLCCRSSLRVAEYTHRERRSLVPLLSFSHILSILLALCSHISTFLHVSLFTQDHKQLKKVDENQ
jgi:hypothetical protein